MGEAPMEFDAMHGDKSKKGKRAKRERMARTRAKGSTKVNSRAARSGAVLRSLRKVGGQGEGL